jgi:hypothetical protein
LEVAEQIRSLHFQPTYRGKVKMTTCVEITPDKSETFVWVKMNGTAHVSRFEVRQLFAGLKEVFYLYDERELYVLTEDEYPVRVVVTTPEGRTATVIENHKDTPNRFNVTNVLDFSEEEFLVYRGNTLLVRENKSDD